MLGFINHNHGTGKMANTECSNTTQTPAQLTEQLQQLDEALAKLVAGQRMKSLTVGSGEFQRRYSFTEVTYENLAAERARVRNELEIVSPAAPTFRESSVMYTTYEKLA